MHRLRLTQDEAVDSLLLPFVDELEALSADDHPAKRPAASMSEEEAARIIQSAWRRRFIRNSFFEDYQGYMALTSATGDEATVALSKRMFGKTVAQDFRGWRFQHPDIRAGEFYHRSNYAAIMDTGFISFLFRSPDFNLPLPIDHAHYLPVCAQASFSLVDIIQNSFPHLQIMPLPKTSVILLYSASGITQDDFDYLSALGLIASKWQLSQVIANYTYRVGRNISPFNRTVLSEETMTFRDSNEMTLLRRLALSKRAPTRTLAANLFRLLMKLEMNDADKVEVAILNRVYLALNVLVAFYKNNYVAFSQLIYCIIHEVTLLAHHRLRRNECLITYDDFKNDVSSCFINAFGLDAAKNNLETIAIPANSGANAFAIAVYIANALYPLDEGELEIKAVKPFYFEFYKLHDYSNAHFAHVYIISTGPMAEKNGLHPGTDINLFIRKTVLPVLLDGISTNHVMILIDASTSLNENLKLDEDLLKYVTDYGLISFIVFKSGQKFDLLHSDQVQYGSVCAIFKKNIFNQAAVLEIEAHARADLSSHLDMQVGAYLSAACGSMNLEKIKQKHFEGGNFYYRAFSQFNGSEMPIRSFATSQKKPAHYLFYIIATKSALFNGALHAMTMRDSFGHFETSFTGIQQIQVRLSASASDEIDHFLEIAEMKAHCLFKRQIFSKIIDAFMIEMISNKITRYSLRDSITLLVLLLCEHKTRTVRYDPFSIFIRLVALQQHFKSPHPLLSGRTIDKALFEYSEALFKRLKKEKCIARFLRHPLDAENTLRFMREFNKYRSQASPAPAPKQPHHFALFTVRAEAAKPAADANAGICLLQ